MGEAEPTIDALTGQHVQPRGAVAYALKLRQVSVVIECRDTVEEAQPIPRPLDLDRSRRPVCLDHRPQPEAVVNRHAESSEESSREPAKALPRRDASVAMVQILRRLAFDARLSGRVADFADVVVRTDDDQMVRIGEKPSNRSDLRALSGLLNSKGVEADDDDRGHVGEESVVE